MINSWGVSENAWGYIICFSDTVYNIRWTNCFMSRLIIFIFLWSWWRFCHSIHFYVWADRILVVQLSFDVCDDLKGKKIYFFDLVMGSIIFTLQWTVSSYYVEEGAFFCYYWHANREWILIMKAVHMKDKTPAWIDTKVKAHEWYHESSSDKILLLWSVFSWYIQVVKHT